jgi:hypothetical protein
VKTLGALLDELYALIDVTKLNGLSVLERINPGNINYYTFNSNLSTGLRFTRGAYITATSCTVDMIEISSSSTMKRCATSASSSTFTDLTTSVPTDGEIIKLTY